MAQLVKNLPEMHATAWNAGHPDSSPESEDPLEKEIATHSSFIAWEIPWIEEPGGLQSMRSEEVDTT